MSNQIKCYSFHDVLNELNLKESNKYLRMSKALYQHFLNEFTIPNNNSNNNEYIFDTIYNEIKNDQMYIHISLNKNGLQYFTDTTIDSTIKKTMAFYENCPINHISEFKLNQYKKDSININTFAIGQILTFTNFRTKEIRDAYDITLKPVKLLVNNNKDKTDFMFLPFITSKLMNSFIAIYSIKIRKLNPDQIIHRIRKDINIEESRQDALKNLVDHYNKNTYKRIKNRNRKQKKRMLKQQELLKINDSILLENVNIQCEDVKDDVTPLEKQIETKKKILCCCGSNILTNNLTRHLLTKKHINFTQKCNEGKNDITIVEKLADNEALYKCNEGKNEITIVEKLADNEALYKCNEGKNDITIVEKLADNEAIYKCNEAKNDITIVEKLTDNEAIYKCNEAKNAITIVEKLAENEDINNNDNESDTNNDKISESNSESLSDEDEDEAIIISEIVCFNKRILFNDKQILINMIQNLYNINNNFQVLLQKYTTINIIKDIHYDNDTTKKGLHFNVILFNKTEHITSSVLHFYINNNTITNITAITNII